MFYKISIYILKKTQSLLNWVDSVETYYVPKYRFFQNNVWAPCPSSSTISTYVRVLCLYRTLIYVPVCHYAGLEPMTYDPWMNRKWRKRRWETGKHLDMRARDLIEAKKVGDWPKPPTAEAIVWIIQQVSLALCRRVHRLSLCETRWCRKSTPSHVLYGAITQNLRALLQQHVPHVVYTSRLSQKHCVAHTQTAVTDYLKSKQLLLFAFETKWAVFDVPIGICLL